MLRAAPDLQGSHQAWALDASSPNSRTPFTLSIPANQELEIHFLCRGTPGAIEIAAHDGSKRTFWVKSDQCGTGNEYSGKKFMGPHARNNTFTIHADPNIEFTAVAFFTPAAPKEGAS